MKLKIVACGPNGDSPWSAFVQDSSGRRLGRIDVRWKEDAGVLRGEMTIRDSAAAILVTLPVPIMAKFIEIALGGVQVFGPADEVEVIS